MSARNNYPYVHEHMFPISGECQACLEASDDDYYEQEQTMNTMNTQYRFQTRPSFVEAMQFTTNNEQGSPSMDAIVNWCNQGKLAMVAWHNGTDILVKSPADPRNASALNGYGEHRAQVGDWIVKEATGFHVYKPVDFATRYVPTSPVAPREEGKQ